MFWVTYFKISSDGLDLIYCYPAIFPHSPRWNRGICRIGGRAFLLSADRHSCLLYQVLCHNCFQRAIIFKSVTANLCFSAKNMVAYRSARKDAVTLYRWPETCSCNSSQELLILNTITTTIFCCEHCSGGGVIRDASPETPGSRVHPNGARVMGATP